MRIAVVTPIPTPYRDPLWERLSRETETEVSVVYCARGRADRPWGEQNGYSFQRLFPKTRNLLSWAGWGRSCYWTSGMPVMLNELQPDVVLVGGYNHLAMLAAVNTCVKRGIPWLLMCETWRRRGGVTGQMKHRVLSRWLRTAAGGLPTGRLASEFLSELGIPEKRQFLLPNVPDLEQLRETAAKYRATAGAIRRELQVPDGHRLILFAARMIPKKRPLLMIDAFRRLADQQPMTLVMLGDGPLRAEAESLVASAGLKGRVRFPGFVSPGEVHRWMSVADVFVQPSSETWGVAPIEALACGCPVILSRDIGCHADVVTDENCGTIIDQADVDHLAVALSDRLSCNTSRDELPERRKDWIAENSYPVLIPKLQGFLAGITRSVHRAG